MAGYKKAGADLDTLLEPWQAGDGNAAATGYKIAGADLNTKYAPASAGTGYTGGTNFKQVGSDIGPRFCAKGMRNLAINGQSYSTAEIIPPAANGEAAQYLRLNADGTYQLDDATTHSGNHTLATGNWYSPTTAGIGASYEAIITAAKDATSFNAAITNNYAAWTTITGTGSVALEIHAGPNGSQSGTRTSVYTVNVKIRRKSDLVVVSDSTYTATVETDGSA